MINKPLDYWDQKYANSNYNEKAYIYIFNQDLAEDAKAAWKTLDLLGEYVAFYRPLPSLGISIPWGGSMGRFFSCSWNRHHAKDVQDAISDFFNVNGYYAHAKDFHSVAFVLALVKKQIGNKPINENGDLAKILEVVKNATGIDYFSLNADAVYTNKKAEILKQEMYDVSSSSI